MASLAVLRVKLIYCFSCSGEKIKEIQPDVLLCDQIFHTPAMYSLGIPVFFIVSANPLIYGFNGYPKIGLDTGVNDTAEIERIDKEMEKLRLNTVKLLASNFEQCGIDLPKGVAIEHPISPSTASIYAYPLEGKVLLVRNFY